MKRYSLVILALVFSYFLYSQDSSLIPERQWSGYRGNFARGSLDNVNLPDRWDIDNSVNVLWKIRVPGLALSGPVIWGDRLFITTAISNSDTYGLKTGIYGDGKPVDDQSQHNWKVYCIDKYSGEII